MQPSLRIGPYSQTTPPYRRWLAPIAAGFGTLAFLAAPYPLEHKAHAFLHGICAQRPSHSLHVGGELLPFDARMTGIYTGFLIGFIVLVIAGRHRHAGFLSPGAFVVTVLLVGAMAIDGVNSLFTDLSFSTPYEPRNAIRLFSGVGAGIGFAIMLTMLLAMSLWRGASPSLRIAKRWWEPAALYLAAAAAGLGILVAPDMLFGPLAVALVLAAVAAFAGLSLVTITLVSGRENSYERAGDLQPQIVAAALIGAGVIAVLAAVRFCLEGLTNAPPLS